MEAEPGYFIREWRMPNSIRKRSAMKESAYTILSNQHAQTGLSILHSTLQPTAKPLSATVFKMPFNKRDFKNILLALS
jgi:hypothetical protein